MLSANKSTLQCQILFKIESFLLRLLVSLRLRLLNLSPHTIAKVGCFNADLTLQSLQRGKFSHIQSPILLSTLSNRILLRWTDRHLSLWATLVKYPGVILAGAGLLILLDPRQGQIKNDM